MLNRLLLALVSIAVILNVYIYNYPVLHRCAFDKNAEIRLLAFGDPQITGAGRNTTLRKRLDIAGNDMFLAHTVRTLRSHLHPDMVFVLGDLISSQWIPTAEFHDRADRFAKIFPPDSQSRLYNISGNHDVGYHGEMSQERVSRFEERYGQVNFVENFEHPHPWRIVGINSMALDAPPQDIYYDQVHAFLDTLPHFDGATVLLTHVPLYKPEGVCRDGPFFQYYQSGKIRAQNHLSLGSSLKILQKVFGSDPNGIILAGHDHEGCHARYQLDENTLKVTPDGPGLQEITVRSVMGEYGGNGGLVSGIWDKKNQKLDFKFSLCRFQVQHLWWATTGLTYVTIAAVSLRILAAIGLRIKK